MLAETQVSEVGDLGNLVVGGECGWGLPTVRNVHLLRRIGQNSPSTSRVEEQEGLIGIVETLVSPHLQKGKPGKSDKRH